MTYCALNAALLQTTLYKSQLEFSLTNISNKRMQIAWQTMQLSDADWENDPRIKKLQSMDSYLEMQQKQIETQLKAATTQLESFEKAVQTNVAKDHKLNLTA